MLFFFFFSWREGSYLSSASQRTNSYCLCKWHKSPLEEKKRRVISCILLTYQFPKMCSENNSPKSIFKKKGIPWWNHGKPYSTRCTLESLNTLCSIFYIIGLDQIYLIVKNYETPTLTVDILLVHLHRYIGNMEQCISLF